MKYCQSDLVKIARRENNNKRAYLVVDPLQGKHIPVSPGKALALFQALADKVKGKYNAEGLLVIGFAETATAIGAQVAIALGAHYMQTTREQLPGVQYLFFAEEHSHATEQKLVQDDLDAILPQIDTILFVEDEVTTGKTILNIIRILQQKYGQNLHFAVASLLNGMSEEHLEAFSLHGIDINYLVKTDHSSYTERALSYNCDGRKVSCNNQSCEVAVLDIQWAMNTRRLVSGSLYEGACAQLAEQVLAAMRLQRKQKILVVGTEECMYPAIYVGRVLEGLGHEVMTHSTTRSPIDVSAAESYPVHCRYALQSVYDADRRTFIYDIGTYDQVLVVTDAGLEDRTGLYSLVNALREKNQQITVVRWC